MPIRITGMNSGLDTESIITELVKAKSTKKDKLIKEQTKLEWKQNAWKELNTKVYALYSKTLSNMRLQSDYMKKTTKVGNSSAATVITGGAAVNGVQTLKIDKLATTGYLTGGELQKDGVKGSYTGSTKLSELGITESSQIRLTVDGKTTNIELNGDMTINDFVSKAKSAGVNASFDSKNQRFFISAKNSGKAADFTLSAKDGQGLDALNKMGLATSNEYSQLCNVDDNGVYSAKDATQLKTVIDAEVNNRAAKYASYIKSYQNADKKIKELEEKYKDNPLEDKAELEEQLKEKEAALEAEGADKEAINAEIKAIKERISAREELDKYTQQKEEAKTNITNANPGVDLDAEPPVFAGDNFVLKADGSEGYEATENLKESIKNEVLAEAEFAAEVMNGTAQVNGQVLNVSGGATRIKGEDAQIVLNGATFTSNVNTFEINGLTITANAVAEEFNLTTTDDVDGIYDMIKNFFKEYNALINEMDKLYNAESSKGYEPLTDEEKEAMSEKEIEKWEEKIKNSLLRKDSTLSNVSGAMKTVMTMGVTIGGKQMYLSDFGINTLGYFNAADNEKGAYHIDGDPDDTSTSGNSDKLKTAIANNPEQVVEFFTSLSKNLYEKLGDLMKKTSFSSSFTLYDDVAMKEEYDGYKTKITQQEQKITDFEDRYYKKFSAMETALAKMSSKESAISGLLGM